MFSSSPKLKKTHSLPDSIHRSPTLSASSVSLSSRLQSNFPPNSQTHTHSHIQFTVHSSQFKVHNNQRWPRASRPFHWWRRRPTPTPLHGPTRTSSPSLPVTSSPFWYHFFSLLCSFFLFFFGSCWKKLDALAMKHSKNHN